MCIPKTTCSDVLDSFPVCSILRNPEDIIHNRIYIIISKYPGYEAALTPYFLQNRKQFLILLKGSFILPVAPFTFPSKFCSYLFNQVVWGAIHKECPLRPGKGVEKLINSGHLLFSMRFNCQLKISIYVLYGWTALTYSQFQIKSVISSFTLHYIALLITISSHCILTLASTLGGTAS